MKKVDFFIVGQPKSGTTALAQFLSEHPEVCLSRPKETEFLATDLHRESDEYYGKKSYFTIRSESDYERCFAHRKDDQVAGEATAIYLRSNEAARNIYKHNPDAKIIMLLRNPADFVYSMHMQNINSSMEDEADFEKALALEDKRRKGDGIPNKVRYPSALYYSDLGKYHDQIKRYFDIFPRKNILVFTNEEFKENNKAVYRKTVKLLGISDDFTPDFKEVHKSKTPRFRFLTDLLHTPILWKTVHRILPPALYVKISAFVHKLLLKEQSRTKMDESLRRELNKKFAADVKKTGKLLGRDLAKEWKI